MHRGGDARKAVRSGVLSREDRHHARHRQRGGRVDLEYAGVRVDGTHDARVQQTFRLQVVRITSLTLHESEVLAPPQ